MKIYDDNGIMLEGDATQWDDLVNSLIGQRLYSSAGTVDYDYDENAISFSPSGSITTTADRVQWNLQKPHAAKTDSSLYPHIHFEQTSTNNVVFTLRYRIQCNGDAKTTAWTTVTANTTDDSVFTYTSGTLNQILAFPAIDWADCPLSSTVEFQMTRTDSTAGVVLATFVDSHVEYDMLGSRQEYIK